VPDTLSLKEAAGRVGVSPDTLRRWAREGVIPEVDGGGEWTSAAVAHARIVARLRDRGHALEEIKSASDEGRLAYSYIDDMFDGERTLRTLDEAAELTGLEPALIERFWASLGLSSRSTTWRPSWTRASRWWRCFSSAACTARRCPRSPTPRCGSSICTSTSR
jgi:excisionase family DNA binding protein